MKRQNSNRWMVGALTIGAVLLAVSGYGQMGTTWRVSVSSTGVQGNEGSALSSLSADGRFVAFESYASNLVPSDTNGVYDVFVHQYRADRLLGDVNDDGCVDDADLLMVLFAFGNSGAGMPEDLNGDGVVDDADLLMVLFNFGAGC